jgi:hypothetical protein
VIDTAGIIGEAAALETALSSSKSPVEELPNSDLGWFDVGTATKR